MSPLSPFSPVSPFGPAGPAGPVAPLSPVSPLSPFSPVSPLGILKLIVASVPDLSILTMAPVPAATVSTLPAFIVPNFSVSSLLIISVTVPSPYPDISVVPSNLYKYLTFFAITDILLNKLLNFSLLLKRTMLVQDVGFSASSLV